MPRHAAPRPPGAGRAAERFLRAEAARARLPVALSVLAGAVAGLALIAQCRLLARAVALAVVGQAPPDAARGPLALLLAAIGVRVAGSFVSALLAFEAGARVRASVRARLVAHLATLGPAWSRRRSTGAVTGTVLDEVEAIGAYYAGYLPQRALVAFLPLAILVYVLPTDWVSGVILLVTAPLVPLFMVLIGRGTEALNRAQWRRLARLAGHLLDAIEGLATLALFGASRAEAAALARSGEAYRRATMAVLRVAFLSSLALEFLATISIAMVAVYVGLRLYYRELDFLPGFTVLLLAPEFFRPLRAMGAQYHARMSAIGAAQAIEALLAETPAPALRGTGRLGPGPVREIVLERVSFRHPDADPSCPPALDGIDLALGRGRRTVLVGRSGAGKTTLGQLLLGFHGPSSGRILVDGVDLASLDPEAWRRRVAWLPQRPTLFAGSILDNLRLGRPDADPARVRRALERAGAAAMVDGLPGGVGFAVGEHGRGLSGGQIQRIALARVFLAEAELVLLDEPGTALDREAAAAIGRAIAALAERAAVLVIAHRPETVLGAESVVTLDRGRVVGRARGDAGPARAPARAPA